MSARWRRVDQSDASSLRAFIEPRESFAAGFSSRVLDESGGLARMRRDSGGIFMLEDSGEVLAAVLLSPSGTAFPVLSEALEDDEAGAVAELSRLYGSKAIAEYRPSACVGAEPHVRALVTALDWAPDYRLEYVSMSVGADSFHATSGGSAPGVVYRAAGPDDIAALLPLAEAYERAEVLTAMHVFDPEACKAAQAHSLKRHVVYVASSEGRLVARAQTNARGWSADQIGGVFVVPEERRKGFGRGVVEALVSDIAGRGRLSSLFVKKANTAARLLYESLGFSVTNDFTVAYFR